MQILIAEDEPIIRMGLKAMLLELGHEVAAATNGQEALEMARRRSFDLAVLDIKMPYTNGLQAAKVLGRTTPLPIILLTAYSEQSLIDEASDLPIHGYLVKPVRPEQLAATIAVARKRFTEEQIRRQEAEKLAQKLAGRKLIDQAKARLIAKGMTEEEAYQSIQQQARRSRRPAHEVASAILEGQTE